MTPDQIAELKQKKYNATVLRLTKIHSDLMLLRVRPDFVRPNHRPGQYTSLGLGYWEPRHPGCQEEQLDGDDEGRLARRAYSISCSVLDDQGDLLRLEATDWLEFYIVLVRESDRPEAPALTPRLFMMREGDRLFAGEKITGHFTLADIKPEDTIVFLATGTGEAPHNYMLWELLRNGHAGKIVSVCCVRYQKDLGYAGIHQQLMERHPQQYSYIPLTTREASVPGQKLYIQDLIQSGQLEERLGKPLDPAQTHVYLCGNPKMIGVPTKDRETGNRVYPEPLGVIEILEKRGFRADQPNIKLRGNLHFEEYW